METGSFTQCVGIDLGGVQRIPRSLVANSAIGRGPKIIVHDQCIGAGKSEKHSMTAGHQRVAYDVGALAELDGGGRSGIIVGYTDDGREIKPIARDVDDGWQLPVGCILKQ